MGGVAPFGVLRDKSPSNDTQTSTNLKNEHASALTLTIYVSVDAGAVVFHCITAGTRRSGVKDASGAASIKETVAETSDTPVKQVLCGRSACVCVLTPAAGPPPRWEIALMFSGTATLPLHQYLSSVDR